MIFVVDASKTNVETQYQDKHFRTSDIPGNKRVIWVCDVVAMDQYTELLI